MNPVLLAALIQQVAVPELLNWLRNRHASGAVVTDADILAKLGLDADAGIMRGLAWLAAHPPVA
jgi:hypothetical protein